jgi:hypothetical protein
MYGWEFLFRKYDDNVERHLNGSFSLADGFGDLSKSSFRTAWDGSPRNVIEKFRD